MVERQAYTLVVPGSSPGASTKTFVVQIFPIPLLRDES